MINDGPVGLENINNLNSGGGGARQRQVRERFRELRHQNKGQVQVRV